MPDNQRVDVPIPALFTTGSREAGERILDTLMRVARCHNLGTGIVWLAGNIPGLAGGKGRQILEGTSSISPTQFETLVRKLGIAAEADGCTPPTAEDLAPGWAVAKERITELGKAPEQPLPRPGSGRVGGALKSRVVDPFSEKASRQMAGRAEPPRAARPLQHGFVTAVRTPVQPGPTSNEPLLTYGPSIDVELEVVPDEEPLLVFGPSIDIELVLEPSEAQPVSKPYKHSPGIAHKRTPEEKDALYAQARAAVIEGQCAAYEYLKAQLGISYRLCVPLLSRLQAEGVVGPPGSAKNHGRLVLIKNGAPEEAPRQKQFTLTQKTRRLRRLAAALGSDSELGRMLDEVVDDLREAYRPL